MSKAKSPQASNADLRRQLDADVEKFLKSGNKIQQIPSGVSSQDYSKGRKHIVLGKSKQQSQAESQDEDDDAEDDLEDLETDSEIDDLDESEPEPEED